jgi:hypothetical protein
MLILKIDRNLDVYAVVNPDMCAELGFLAANDTTRM